MTDGEPSVEVQHITEQRLAVNSTQAKAGFWHGQFSPTVTWPQIIFDVVFGVIGPILCFVFDPIVFRGWFLQPLFPDYQNFVYLFSGLQITLLCFWLLTGPGVRAAWNRLIGGMLLCGGVFCVMVGLVLAPFSLMGLLIYGIGILGSAPFLTALVYLRNSSRALRAGKVATGFGGALIPAAGIVLVAGLPLLLSIQIHLMVSRAVTEILEGDSQHAIFAAHRLVPLRYFAGTELDPIVNAYAISSDEKRKELLKSCYREITGDSIENRMAILDD